MSITDIKGLEDFLQSQEAAVLSVPIDGNGTIHGAGLLYAHDERPLQFIFVTSSKSEKCNLLNKQKTVPASCVIGTTKGTPFSLQMRGRVTIKEISKAKKEIEIYKTKRGKAVDDFSDSDQVVLIFRPDWARCTIYDSTDFQDGFKRVMLDI